MLNMRGLLLVLLSLLSGCATSVPQAVSCPPPPPVPQVLLEQIDSGPSPSERIETLLKAYEERVNAAAKP